MQVLLGSHIFQDKLMLLHFRLRLLHVVITMVPFTTLDTGIHILIIPTIMITVNLGSIPTD
jgi:hypothetical protein